MDNASLSLEHQYSGRAMVPEHAAILERWRDTSTAFRARTRANIDVHYGALERQRMDLFHADNARGTLVFIHGGYWRALDKSDFSFVAAPFVDAGVSVALVNYRLCPAVPLREVVADCQDALTWLAANGARYDMPVDRIALSGHSAGGHLAAMLFATDWTQRGVAPSTIAGGVALSGLFDLEPLLQISLNNDLRLASASDARAVSPAHLAPALSVPLYLAAGADESAAFRQQTQWLQRAWPGVCAETAAIAGANHFTIVDHFAQTGSSSFRFIERLFAD